MRNHCSYYSYNNCTLFLSISKCVFALLNCLGYVLSKEALKKFIEEALPAGNNKCRQDHGGAEDVEMGTAKL